jgi:Putative Flp pilus-assembly TadE/G-like
MIVPASRRRERGQVLPLFALFLVVLLGFAALAIDVSGAYSARRFYRSAADAAALAGAQDLQLVGTRTVGPAERIRARQHAMDSLVAALGISGGLPGPCDTSTDVDVTDSCVLGTNYHVSIKAGTTPGSTAIACQDCDPARSVQVGLRNAAFGLTFARVLGQSTWNVGVTSVAGMAFGKAYAIETLRPPKKAGSTFLVNDIDISGGSVVNVQHGDVGTNANMDYSGVGSIMNLDSGYGMFYFDPLSGPGWPGPPISPNQTVQKISTLIADPGYNYPAMRGSLGSKPCAGGPPNNCAPTFTDARTSTCGAPSASAACTSALLDPLSCGVEATYLQTSVYSSFMATQPLDKVYCYKPGIYDPSSNSKRLSSGPAEVVILMPGAYYFKSPNGGLDIGGWLLGGYRPNTAGVALVFDECSNQCIFSGNNALTIALNAGTKFPPGTSGSAATAAIDWNNQLVQTSGPASPTPPLLMTLLVNKDPSCFVPTSAPFQEPLGCDPGTHDKTINIAGGGSLALEGVQYAPTDNIEIAGGSSGTGHVGQIIAWTLKYSGGTHINQEGPPSQGPGTLRLDAACTAPSSPCSP